MQMTRKDLFACATCGAAMEQMHGVPVLQSLAGHAIYRCGACGHILLLQEEREPANAGWLSAIPTDGGAISCASWGVTSVG